MKHSETFFTTKNIKNIKLAIFSDLHYYDGFKQKTLDIITKQITNTKPDYICIVGDIVDESKKMNLNPLTTFLNNISSIAPIICVLGNHDEKSGSLWHWKYARNTELINELKKVPNLHLLEYNIYKDNNIVFYGFNPSYDYYEKYDETY
jgi:predicted MPP superfamily phosphohydrolase